MQADDAEELCSGMSSEDAEVSRSRPKRNPGRSAKQNPWGEEKLLTSTKSKLIDLDLVKLLASPKAWECLDEPEKREILSLLPAHVHPNPDPSPDDPNTKMPPLPESFLRYSNHWREGVRQFQIDLENGRYDPEWLRQADEAMKDRAAGRFDNFKESEFEQFWGQKQKIHWGLLAGDSSQVKLETLIEHGIVRVGDVWRYSRVFGKREERILLEKEAKLMEISGSKLTFAMPPGQRVVVPHGLCISLRESQGSSEIGGSFPTGQELQDHIGGESDARPSSITESNSSLPVPSEKRKKLKRTSDKLTVEIADVEPVEHSKPQAQFPDSTEDAVMIDRDEAEGASQPKQIPENEAEPIPEHGSSNGAGDHTNDIIYVKVSGPTALATKILQIDGRVANIKHANPWKEIRCYRDHQDMGSLWEMRQAWYVRQ